MARDYENEREELSNGARDREERRKSVRYRVIVRERARGTEKERERSGIGEREPKGPCDGRQ